MTFGHILRFTQVSLVHRLNRQRCTTANIRVSFLQETGP
jgi:hypothetical protein